MKYTRWLMPQVKQALESRRVVVLVGPRQSGKTTLVKTLSSRSVDYRTLDDLTLLDAAQNDAQAFVKRTEKLMVIDEVQRVPELLLAVKQAVDDNSQRGQYLLTGSANIQQLPTVTESLAGRIAKLRLRPLSQGEINRKKPCFFRSAFDSRFTTSKSLDREAIIEMALGGGFPEPLTLKSAFRNKWHQDYLAAILDHDLKEIINIRRRDSMQSLLKVLAAWSSKHIDLSAIQSSLSIKRSTVEAYLNALEALFLVERLPAWGKTDYERVTRRDKLFMSDSGMMSAILNWQYDQIRLDGDKVGKLLETLIYNELAAHVECQMGYQLYHYRDREKREIDFIVERDDGALLGIEVKAGSSVKREHFKHLCWFSENLVKPGQSFVGIVLYAGEKVVPFGENLLAVPMSCLFGE